MGTKDVVSGASLIGLAEIENEGVIKIDSLASRGLEYVHFDLPDKRGIDVATFYEPLQAGIT